MDGLQTYSPPSSPAISSVPGRPAAFATVSAANPAAVKTPSDYVLALKRRFWLILMVGVPLSTLVALYVVRQPAYYQATAMIQIQPPQYDQVLSTIVSHDVGRVSDRESNDKYLPNRVAYLKSKALAQKVVNDPAFLQGEALPDIDAADMLLLYLSTRQIIGSNWVQVTLEGTDPARTTRQLQTLLSRFAEDAKDESLFRIDTTKQHATATLAKLQDELKALNKAIVQILSESKTIGPGGKNIIEAQYVNVSSLLLHKQMRISEVQQQAWFSLMPRMDRDMKPQDGRRFDQIQKLQDNRALLLTKLDQVLRVSRNPTNEPAYKDLSGKIRKAEQQIKRLEDVVPDLEKEPLDPTETIVASLNKEIRVAEETSKDLLAQLRASMPEHQKYLALQDEKELLVKRISDMKTKISGFDSIASAQAQEPPVTIPAAVTEPTVPVRPRRMLNILAGLVVCFGMGIAMVCLTEHLDHSVKVPEHLSIGLNLPLLGVVPRIRRTSLTNRGGHLWTPATPDSVEADAYRNLRASLLGASDRLGPIVTLLVTSAKAGEGKSTTALNLAATCARAGERTLLMDVDLRRPSLREVFESDGRDLGLVDVLRGELPWQRTVVRTDIPSLDFLPTGDATKVPIEILGTLELRQLLIALSGHYDRVILDGPAVLGLADCRMLGRVVDSAIVVVKSGTHEMRPLQRAKAMLEQSHVLIAGVVFNGLHDDLQNWSSYGPYQPYASPAGVS